MCDVSYLTAAVESLLSQVLQIAYMAFAGTTGSSFMTYIATDATTTPPGDS
jgi:predicted O-linked N-acetylglucosamine transferase (SPINDLY family)